MAIADDTNWQEQGFELVNNFVSPQSILAIKKELKDTAIKFEGAGIRNAERKFGSVRTVLLSTTLKDRVQKYFENEFAVVRVILFNKTPENNWRVTWHQDKTVAVSAYCELEGWGPWSLKDDTQHVQPPLNVLNEMVTVRIHIDDCEEENGALKVVPGSHTQGILSPEEIQKQIDHDNIVICNGASGSALVMRPHLLHSSSKSNVMSARRVLHIEFSSFKLPQGLDWACNVC